MTNITWTIALKNSELSSNNIEIALNNTIWGMKNAGIHREIKSGDYVVFLIGVSIGNIEHMRKLPTYIEPKNVFPNYSNEILTDDFTSEFEFMVDTVLYGVIDSDFYIDKTEVWPPSVTTSTNKKTGVETQKTNYFPNRFQWSLTHKAEGVLFKNTSSNLEFHTNIIKALRSKRVEPSKLKHDELEAVMSLLTPVLTEVFSEELYHEKIEQVTPANIPLGTIPIPTQSESKNSMKWKRDARIARRALENSNFECEYDPSHLTFVSRTTNKNFVEAHHLIPMEMQAKFEFSIDVPENILSLCPNCHKKFHHSLGVEIQELIGIFYPKRTKALEARGIKIKQNELIEFYVANEGLEKWTSIK